MQDTLAKKIFAVGSAAAMVMSLSVGLVAHAAPHGLGTNVLTSDGTVWMVTSAGRRAYTSWGAFVSYGFNSQAGIVTASSDDLALPVDPAGFIPPQDGTVFCATVTKGSDVKGECSLITGGMKAAYTSAAVFTGLGFSFSRAVSGDSSFMTKTANIDNATAQHLPGVLVNNGGTVQLVGTNGLLGIPDLATFNSWGYSFSNVVPANAADKTLTQTGVMAMRQPGQLSPTAMAPVNPNQPPVVNGSVSAMLSSDTPASGTLVSASAGSQVGADVAHFTFSGSGTVTQIVIKRIGVSADTSIANVYLYLGNARITDAGTFSNGLVSFSNSAGLFTVNGSAVVSVRMDMANSISGQTVGAQLASYTVANGTPMSTSISGNLFNTALVTDLATVKLGSSSNTGSITGSGANQGTNGTINAGTVNANLWGTTVTVGQRAVKLQYMQFRQIGSVAQDAIQNLKLMVDGSQAGNTTSVTNIGSNSNVVMFDLSGSPVSLSTGAHTIELHGDVVKGTSYNYEFTMQTQSDALFLDSSYNVAVPLTHLDGTTILQLNPGLTTVNSGTVTVQQDPAYTQTQFVKNGSQVVLGSWTMKAYGEDVKVQTLSVVLNYFDSSGSAVAPATTEGFNNLGLFVNGAQVGSSQNALYASSGNVTCGTDICTAVFGTTNLFILTAGQAVTVQVKGDSTLATGTSVASVRTDLETTASALQGVTSFSLTPTTATTYVGVSLTVGSSSATLSKNTAYNNQTISPNLVKQKIGSFVIQASQADGVRVNQLTVAFAAGANDSANPTTTLANLYVVTPDFPNGTTPVAPSASTNVSVNFTVAANQTATVDVYADISNTHGTVQVTLSGTGIGVTSSQTVSLSSTTGQVLTVGSGTLNTPTLDASSPIATFVIAGGTNQAAATFNFVASSGGLTITQLDFQIATTTNATSVPVTALIVGGITGSIVGATSTVTGLNIAVPTTYSGVNVPVTMNLANVGSNGVLGGSVFTVNLTHVKYVSGGTTTDKYSNAAGFGNLPSNEFNLVGSAPTISIAAPSALLTSGNQTVAKVTVTANAGGNIVLEGLPLTFAAAGGASTTVVSGYGSAVTIVDDTTGQTVSLTGAGGVYGVPAFDVEPGHSTSTVITLSSDNTIAAGTSKTYDIQLNVNGGAFATSPGASISTTLGLATGLTFKDVNSGKDAIAAGSSPAINGGTTAQTFIPNYPVNSVSIHN